jgi:hypothetical protein
MRILLLAIFIFITSVTYSQKKTVTITKATFGEVNCVYDKEIIVENRDTTYYLTLVFRNLEYPGLGLMGSIAFSNQYDVRQLIVDMTSVMDETNKDKSSMIEFERALFSVKSMPWGAGKHLRIYEPASKQKSFTVLTHKQAESLIKWLDRIKIGEEPIKK